MQCWSGKLSYELEFVADRSDGEQTSLSVERARLLRSHRKERRTGLVLVSGYFSIGNSSVVNELHKVLCPARTRRPTH